jgi:hypothetical protein
VMTLNHPAEGRLLAQGQLTGALILSVTSFLPWSTI